MAEKKKSPRPPSRPAVPRTRRAAPSITVSPSADIVVPEAAGHVAPDALVVAEPVVATYAAQAAAPIAAPAPASGPPAVVAPSRDAIARRAQELYRARGGSAFDNWIQAEQELADR